MKKLLVLLALTLTTSFISAQTFNLSKANTVNASMFQNIGTPQVTFYQNLHQQCHANCNANAVDNCIARGNILAVCESVAVEACLIGCDRSFLGNGSF